MVDDDILLQELEEKKLLCLLWIYSKCRVDVHVLPEQMSVVTVGLSY